MRVLGFTPADTSACKTMPQDPRVLISSTNYLTITSVGAKGLELPLVLCISDPLKALTLKWRNPGTPEELTKFESWAPQEGCVHNITVHTDPSEFNQFKTLLQVGVGKLVSAITDGKGPKRFQRILVKDVVVDTGGTKILIPELAITTATDMAQIVSSLGSLPSVPAKFHNLHRNIRTRLGSRKALCVCTQDVTLPQKTPRPMSVGTILGERQFRMGLGSQSTQHHHDNRAPVFNEVSDTSVTNVGIYLPLAKYKDLLKMKEDYERMKMSEKCAKKQIALVANQLARNRTSNTIETIKNSGLDMYNQIDVMGERLLAMELVVQKRDKKQDFKESFHQDEQLELRERLMEMEMQLQMQKTALEEMKEMSRHEKLGLKETIDRQQKTIDELILQNRLYEADKSGVRGFLEETNGEPLLAPFVSQEEEQQEEADEVNSKQPDGEVE